MASQEPVPFAISVQRLFRQDFVFEHDVEFGVARADEQARVIIRSERYQNAQIVERRSRGGLDLTDDLVDRIGLLSFELMAGQMQQRGGESGWWVIDNFVPAVRGCFEPATAEVVVRALLARVRSGVRVMNMCMVEGDDPL